MAKNLYGETENKAKTGSSKKVYALVAVVIVLVAVIGFLVFSGLGGLLGEKITSGLQAENTLSGLGNDVSGINEDLKDIEGNL